jgi:hypothetical protein
MSSAAYEVDSTDDVPGALDLRGLAVLQVPTDGLAPREIQHAIAFSKGAKAIFQGPAVDKDGNGIDEVRPNGKKTGYWVSDYGTMQRRQRPIPDRGQGGDVLVDYRGEA